jgi:hypothetical protein
MTRIVFVVVALFVLWRVLSAIGKRASATGLGADSYSRFHPRQRGRRINLEDRPVQSAPEELLKCRQCGTYVPSGRALKGGGVDVFCSQACRDEHRD